jgi:uncharacterized protein (DUF1810 family)
MADDDLQHFIDAQDRVWPQVTAELDAGRKRTHWMWYVFPQIAGLGRSPTAQHYAIRDMAQARRYLAHPVLGERLRDGIGRVMAHAGRTANAIFGSPDDLKFRSCLTLFREAADDAADRKLFSGALETFYGGQSDQATLDILASG